MRLGFIVVRQRTAGRFMLTGSASVLVVRKATTALLEGEYQSYKAPEGVFAYLRGSEVLVALNFSDQPKTLSLLGGEILLSTHLDRYGSVKGQLELRPNEGVVVRL